MGVLMGEREAAEILKLSPITLRIWRSKKRGPQYVQLGRAIRYRESDLKKFILSNIISHPKENV
jgi:hypothetical protein